MLTAISIFVQAAEDSLLRLYLTKTPPHQLQLPTSTFPEGFGDIFTNKGVEGDYVPGVMGDSEVLFASSERTGLRIPGARSAVSEDREEGTVEL